MKSNILLLSLVLGTAGCCLALDFELRKHRIGTLDGEKVDLYFDHSGSKVFYRPPPRWTWTGDAKQFQASPPEGRAGSLTIQSRSPVPEIPQFGDDACVAKLTNVALAELPAGSEEPKIFATHVEKIGGRELPCVRIVVDYTKDTIRRTRAACFVVFRSDLWVDIRVDAPQRDFARTAAEAFFSLEGFTEVVNPEVSKTGQ